MIGTLLLFDPTYVVLTILITIFYTHIAKEICPPHISPTSDGFRKDGDVVLLREKLKEGALS